MPFMYDFSHLAADDILLYLRKSRTDDQTKTVEEVLQKHEEILDEWSERNLGRKVPEENKFREVVSGETLDERVEILKVLKMVESPRYKAILVVEVARLSRGDLEDAGRLIKLLRYSNTLVITPQKTYDLRDEYDRDAFKRELERGNDYLEYTKKIMQRGTLLSVSQGNYLGSVAPYGYDRTTVKDGKKKCPTLKINEEEAAVVRLIYDMYVNQNIGAIRIANHLESLGVTAPGGSKIWRATTIFTILENIHYIGKVRWNWRKVMKTISDQELKETRPRAKVGEYLIFDGKHEAIISEELFEKAAEVRGSKPKHRNCVELKNPIAGLMFCSCGSGVGLNTFFRDGVEYSPPRYRCNNQRRCKNASVDVTEVLDKVKETLRDCIQDFEVRIDQKQDDSAKLHKALIERMEKQMKDLEAKELEQWELRSTGEMPKDIFDRLNAKVLKEKEELKQALCTAYESMPEPVDYKERVLKFTTALEALDDDSIPAKVKNRYMKEVIERIDYSRPPMLKMNKAKAKELGYDTSVDNKGWYPQPYELHITIKA